jgi:polyphosphate kinase
MLNRDISWLSFNERVLQEAQDSNVPLIERMRFLGIYSNNLDEFFRVRVATSLRLKKALINADPEKAQETAEVIAQIQKKVIALQQVFYSTYEQILDELEGHHIYIKDESGLNEEQQHFVRTFFVKEVESLITPIILSNIKKFPYLKDKAVYLFISLQKKNEKNINALIELPTDDISRFVVLPSPEGEQHIIYLDDIIRFNTPYILSIFSPQEIESYIIKVTRDAELDLDDDFSESYYERITKSLANRKRGRVVRLVYDKEMPQHHIEFILSNIKMSNEDNLIPGGRYHNFRDFMGFPSLGNNQLTFDHIESLDHKFIDGSKPLLKQVSDRDFLFHFPYHSFDYIIDLIREAAIDPKVTSIKMSLYRVAPKSKIIKALKNAARNGKMVYVVIELRARFDEEANLEWSKQLQEENIHIDFGLKGLKVHSKLLLIQRKTRGELKNYTLISTGNFHEKTSEIYSDTALLTSDARITADVAKVFEIFDKPYLPFTFDHLLVAPINLRKGLEDAIYTEINKVKDGNMGSIFLKINNLVDEGIITALYKAADEGVQIKLIVRGVCSLVPRTNILVRSIVGRFLEHSRIFWFGNVDTGSIYLGSADLMTRNLDVRVEVVTPVYDVHLKQELMSYLSLQWKDNKSARVIDDKSNNQMYTNSDEPIDSQIDWYNHL